MVGFVLPGALVEYGTGTLGIPLNIVVFQFNPESITRTINLPTAATSSDPERTARRREHGGVQDRFHRGILCRGVGDGLKNSPRHPKFRR